MNAARRSIKRRDWPRGLREPRPGYYAWDHPDGRTLSIGRVPLAVAKQEALSANLHLAETKPGLVERLTGATRTLADLLAKMPAAENKNTAKSVRSLDKAITAAIGAKACGELTVEDCSNLIEAAVDEGKARSAEALRSRLMAVCRRGMSLGWMDANPAEVTERPKVAVRRGRLTLESFRAIHAKADQAAEWLPQAMMLALVTGADRSSIAALQRADVADGHLTITRSKTGARVAIPLALRLGCAEVTLAELLARRTGVVSRYLVHHVNPWGNAPAGSPVHPDRISHAFTEARKLAGIPDEGAPTFHEIRSLAKRLYTAQGGVDTKALLGHATERMSDLYANPRGVEPIRVRLG
jgi:integrase